MLSQCHTINHYYDDHNNNVNIFGNNNHQCVFIKVPHDASSVCGVFVSSLSLSVCASGSETVHMWGAKWQTHKNNDAFHTKPKECINLFDLSLLRGSPHIRIFLRTGKKEVWKMPWMQKLRHSFVIVIRSKLYCSVFFLLPIIHPNFLYPSYRPWKIDRICEPSATGAEKAVLKNGLCSFVA